AGFWPFPVSVQAAAEEQGLFTSVGPAGYGTTYYVDGESGSDANDGQSPETAWKSLNKASATTFLPGDHILLRASSVWNGQILNPKGSGTAANPIKIDLYELDKSGNAVYTAASRPVINGNGTYGQGSFKRYITGAVMLVNQEYWEIANLEVTNSPEASNPEGYKKPGDAQRAGILLLGYEQNRTFNHFVVRNCYVHDVQSEYYLKMSNAKANRRLKAVGGIIVLGHWVDPDGNYVLNEGDHRSTTGFNDVLIEGNVVRRVGLEGIRTKCDSDTSVSNTFYKKFSNIVIRNNYLEEIAGDAIVLSEVASGGVVEGNVSKKACNADYGTHNYAAIWSMSNNNALFQYNEVYGIEYGYNDAEAYDIDMQCDGVVYQYNYSHHNTGGFLLLMSDQKNSVVRYNISANDGGGNRGTNADDGGGSAYTYKEQSIFHYWVKSESSAMPYIYNNTFYVGDGISTALFGEGNSSDNSGTISRFYNNILYKEGAGSLKFLTNYPTNGAAPTERKMVDNPEYFMKNNLIWPAGVASETSGATPEKLALGGNQITRPGLVLESDVSAYTAGLAGQNNTTFDTATQDIYQFTSKEKLRERAGMFQITPASPAAGAGMVVAGAPEEDFFGNSLTGKVPDIGAHQVSNIPYRTEVEQPETAVVTLAGIYPPLPRSMNVTFKDINGETVTTRTESKAITWDLIPLEQYTAEGSFTVYGAIEGVEEVRARAAVTVLGSVGQGDFEASFAATDAAFIQRSDGNAAYGAMAGASSAPSAAELYKHPFGRAFTNNYVLKIKNATSAAYNRRFVIQFDTGDFEGEWSDLKNASIRLYVSRYDAWTGAGGSNDARLKNTAFMMDVYEIGSGWEGASVTWNNAPGNAEVSAKNHVGMGTTAEQIPTYNELAPISHKYYVNKDIIANGNAIDIDISEYMRGLDANTTTVSFLVDIPMSSAEGFNKDNSGFDAFSTLGAAKAWEDYQAGSLTLPATMPEGFAMSETALAPQLIISYIYEQGVDPISVETPLGTAPALPETATLRYSNGSTRSLGVIWNGYDGSLYGKEGIFVVTGYSSATNIPITAEVAVTADHITGFEALPDIDIVVGYPRNQLGMPQSVTATLASGATAPMAVDGWDDDASNYSASSPPGKYQFPGSVSVYPAGVTNPNGLKPAQTVYTHPRPQTVQFVEPQKTAAAGETIQFEAAVVCAEPYPVPDEWSGALAWSIATTEGEAADPAKISIDQPGKVTAAPGAGIGSYTVQAASLRYSSIKATATLTLQKAGVTSIAIQPGAASVKVGQTRQFTAEVTVQGAADTGVVWSLEGTLAEGTLVSETGLLTVAENETAASFAVVATARADAGKTARAEVTVLAQDAPAVTGVAVSPKTAGVPQGQTQQFSAAVAAENGADESVAWRVSGQTSPGTQIDQSGLLTIAFDEQATTLAIQAASVFDASKADTAEVTVLPNTEPKVLEVSVTPAAVAVRPGFSRQFAAGVQAVNGADTQVQWSLQGETKEGTAINAEGLLTVAADETAQSFAVVAASAYDESVFAAAQVQVQQGAEPIVLSVLVAAPEAAVAKGTRAQLTATVEAEEGADTGVVWSVEGNTSSATAINAAGELQVAFDEAAHTLTVKAASTGNSAVYGTAWVGLAQAVPAIGSVQGFDAVVAPLGTAQAGLGLPQTAEVTLKDGSKATLPIGAWQSVPAYNQNEAGVYSFAGTLDTSAVAGLTNPEGIKAAVQVKLVKVADRTALGELIDYAESAGVQAEAQGAVPG
ncbi:MAG: Ig-like domain-containing protein, partial [Oscillospiraceae bacterium]